MRTISWFSDNQVQVGKYKAYAEKVFEQDLKLKVNREKTI
jgi:hypothetical protein